MVDVYHMFWDPDVERRSRARRAGSSAYHVSDWVAAGTIDRCSRGMMGDGIIDLRRLSSACRAAPATRGPIEVEIINAELRAQPARPSSSGRSSGSPSLQPASA